MSDKSDQSANGDPQATSAKSHFSGRFSEPVSEIVKRFTASVTFDKRLAFVDIAGSLAHARMLARQGVIAKQALLDIERGMASIETEIRAGTFDWRVDLEDVHMNIESRLIASIGDAGKRLHTGRSRNDQIATDIRLWLRGEIGGLIELLRAMQLALVGLAEKHADTIMPGFTHLQVAQPVTFGHHVMAYVEMLARDEARMVDCR
ncbi:MAG: lyase family protein, partial [Usitatibacteraceae bacterium]